ncbi:hypothetical protein [Sphingopyxis sp. C-1]|uniref:hypothetical protein n=1 Tax=Sphingopyxis sp. C-1 TaxID=262667 RepID=UPI00128B9DFA|nr:hypothetical protein [Sphingopyxis sp. C-1]
MPQGSCAAGANNQLAEPEDAERLCSRGIVYCPDYFANSGGIIELHHQRGGGNHAPLARHLASLAKATCKVFARAERTGETTAAIADAIAMDRVKAARS